MTARQPRLGHVVLGGLLVVIGVLWLIDAVTSLDVPWEILLPAALVVVGVGLVYGAPTGTHGGLISFGVILTILVVLASGLEIVFDVPFEGGIGERDHAPTGIADTKYRLAIGDMTVDLTRATSPREPIEISVAMGKLTVIVPEGIGITVDARAGVGEIVVFGRSQSGIGPKLIEDPFGQSDVLPAIRLVVRVGIGKVEVRHP
jgi:hypothetical protein